MMKREETFIKNKVIGQMFGWRHCHQLERTPVAAPLPQPQARYSVSPATAAVLLRVFSSKNLHRFVTPPPPPPPTLRAPPESPDLLPQSLSVLRLVTRAAAFTVKLICLLLFQFESGALTFEKEKSQRLHESLVTDTDFTGQA